MDKLPEVRLMHLHVGRAITRWQYVETGLYIVAHCMLDTGHREASIAFFHVDSARSKVSLTDKLCRAVLPQATYQSAWLPLKKNINAAVDIRNGLAHFDVMLLPPEAMPDLKGQTEYPIALTINSHAPTDGTDIKALFSEQVREASEEFRRLAEALLRFVPDHIPDWQRRAARLPQETLQVLLNHESKATP